MNPFTFFFLVCPFLPEALCLLCEGSWVPSIGWLIQLGQQCLAGLLAWVVCKLDCNGFGGTRWLLTVQTLDGLLGLNSPVKTNKANPSGNAWGEYTIIRLVYAISYVEFLLTVIKTINTDLELGLHWNSFNSNLNVKKQFIGVDQQITNLNQV